MILIALTGGIASGKSAVATRLDELGAVHVDADSLARAAVAPGTPGLAEIASVFGPSVIGADGSLDRAALGGIVFSNPDRLAELNAITHPEVRRLARARFDEAERRDPEAVVVYDVPLLVEARRLDDEHFDLVIVTEASESTRIDRMVRIRGMTEAEARRRILAQASDSERRAVADVVIDTEGDLERTIEQVDAVWARLRG
jgi:dephospho-CoA kinase